MEIDKRSNLEHHVTQAVTLARLQSDLPSTDSLSESSQVHQSSSECVCLFVNNF